MEEAFALAIPEIFSQRLKKNYETTLIQQYDIEEEDFNRIFIDAREEFQLNSRSIALYDFCIIASEADFAIARRVRQNLSQQFHIRGCLIEDLVELGSDIFNRYQNMMDRSTKILFLITQNFTSDHFYVRVQNGAVFQCIVSKATTDREKCVPLILESGKDLKLPLAMAGITGIVFNDSDMETSRDILHNAFANATRKREILQKRYSEKCYKTLVDKKVKETIESLSSSALSFTYSSPQIEASGSSNQIACQVVQQQMPLIAREIQNMTLNMRPAVNANCIQQAQVTQPQQCHISQSKNVRIGDQFQVNVYFDGKNTRTSSSESSDDSSSDED